MSPVARYIRAKSPSLATSGETNASVPCWVGMPATSTLSLTKVGIPENHPGAGGARPAGPGHRPPCATAPNWASTERVRVIAASTSSAADTLPSWRDSTIPTASRSASASSARREVGTHPQSRRSPSEFREHRMRGIPFGNRPTCPLVSNVASTARSGGAARPPWRHRAPRAARPVPVPRLARPTPGRSPTSATQRSSTRARSRSVAASRCFSARASPAACSSNPVIRSALPSTRSSSRSGCPPEARKAAAFCARTPV